MDINRIYCAEQIAVPPDLPLILKDWTKAVIREQPIDALDYSLKWFEASSKAIAAQKIKETQVSQIERTFKTFDIDGSGKMQAKDLSRLLLQDLGFEIPENEIEDALLELDPNNTSIVHLSDIYLQLFAFAEVTFVMDALHMVPLPFQYFRTGHCRMIEGSSRMAKVAPRAIRSHTITEENDFVSKLPDFKSRKKGTTDCKNDFISAVSSPIKSKLQVVGSSVQDLKMNFFRGKHELQQEKKKEDIGIVFYSLRFSDLDMESRYILSRRSKYQTRLKFGASFTSFFIPLLVIMRLGLRPKNDQESWARIPLIMIFPGIVMFTGLTVSIFLRYFLTHPRMLSLVCFIGQISALLDTTKAGTHVNERNVWVHFIFSLGITSSTGLPFLHSMGVLSSSSLFFTMLAWIRYALNLKLALETLSSTGTLTVAVILYSILLCYLAWNWEYEERRDFILTETLAKENVLVQMTMEMTGWFSGGATSDNSFSGNLEGVLSPSCHIDPVDVLIKEELGHGTYGFVYAAMWKETKVAVKKIILKGDTRAVITSFGAEMSVIAQLRHPNIVMFMGVLVHPEFVGLVMELCPKGSIYSVLRSQECILDWSLLLRTLVDASRGMHFLHSSRPPIIHRDLKSANLLIDADWRCKVSDFGLSRLKATPEGFDKKINPDRAFIGSTMWIAPEVFKGHEHTEKSDVYSFGIILFEAISGSVPYLSLSLDAVPFVVQTGKRPTDFHVLENIEAAEHLKTLKHLMTLCWDDDPSARPAFYTVMSTIQNILTKYVGDDKWEDHIVFPDRKVLVHTRSDDGFLIREEDLVFDSAIGKGVFGIVYRGSYFGTSVAIKKLHVSGVPKSSLLEFEKECAIMKGLHHPNIVLFMGSCSKPPTLLLVTELLTNGSFFDIYHQLQRPEPKELLRLAYNIAFDMARGLAYLHNHNPIVIHRDLKSQNILLDDTMRTKIADFGLSKFRDVGKTMSICGSPLWVAPEVLRGEKYDCACDVYSFSIIVWEALAWAEPYPDLGSSEIMNGVASGKLRPIVPSGTPASLAYLLEECWTKSQDQRPTFNELVPRLEAMHRCK